MSSSLVGKVEWSTLQNEVRKPVLIVYPGLFSCHMSLLQIMFLFHELVCVDVIICFYGELLIYINLV